MAEHATRLYAILARNAPMGVIFRRGPSKLVQLLKWDLKTDVITAGQWFKGRVYERRCDLSPDGDFLIYFAAKHKEPYYSWTAISKPPYFTALALWPKGDCWGGGGLFDRDNKGITLNHLDHQMELAEGFRLPPNYRVRPHGTHSGGGEDGPIINHRMARDGWQLVSEGMSSENKFGAKIWIEFSKPEVWQKENADKDTCIQSELHGIKEKDGPWYIQEMQYTHAGRAHQLGRCDWADINQAGVLYYSQGGQLFKMQPGEEAVLIADLSANTFTEVPPCESALEW